MNEKLQKIIRERMTFLPKELQEAINSLDWMGIAKEIGEKYLLSEEEIANLQTETMLVLLGLEEGETYEKNIENEVGTSKEEAGKITDEAEQKIFTPIYDKFTENIKKNLKDKKPNYRQNVNFVLSGGDYSAFVEENNNKV